MTDIESTADFDLDSLFAPDLVSLTKNGLARHGIAIGAIYCLHTGRQIGTLEDDELYFAIDEIDADSEDSLVDQLVERTVAAMRPSITLNRPDHTTLLNLATKRPVDCLAFLVNRLHSNRRVLVERGRETTAFLHDRITMYKRLGHLADAGVDLTPWLHWLLELDSKLNLHDVTPALYTQGSNGKWSVVRRDGISLFWLLDESNHEQFLKLFESWVFALLGEYDERDRRVTREAQWVRGNSLTKRAYVQSWMDNSNVVTRKLDHDAKKAGTKTGRLSLIHI